MPDGEGNSREAGPGSPLRKAAVEADRTRRRLLSEKACGEASREWRALVDGRWSILDSFDFDGRRFLVARRNEPKNRAAPLLDRRERAVLGYRIAGYSLKLIAYELGFTIGHTSRLAQSAMEKLGLRSPADLAAFPRRPPKPDKR